MTAMRHRGVIKSISSSSNPEVKLLTGLRLRKNRDEHGLFLAEGTRTALEGLQCGAAPRYLAYTATQADREPIRRLREACLGAGGTCLEVTESVLAKITRKENPQALVAAFAIDVRRPADQIKPAGDGLYVVLDRIRDPGNLGTVIRTADCVAASGLVLVGDCCDPYSVEAVRATMGSIFNVPIFRCSEPEFVKLASTWPGGVVGASPGGAVDYLEANADGPTLSVLGNEQVGMSGPIADACTQIVRIPIFGRAESLNLAVAAGILLYTIKHAKKSLPGVGSHNDGSS